MSQLPPIHIEPPFKWLKHVEKLDTSVFPTCHTVEREWKTLSLRTTLPSIAKNYMYVHHDDTCKYDIVLVKVDRENFDVTKYSL